MSMNISVAELMATVAAALTREHPDVRWQVTGGKDIQTGVVTIIASSISEEKEDE